jgi:SLT domain-containing protein
VTTLQWKLLGYAVAGVWVLAAIGVALLGAYSHGVSVTDDRWEAKVAKEAKAQAIARADAERAARAEELRHQAAANEAGTNARKENEALANDVARADDAGQRMRDAADKLATTASCAPGDPSATRRGETATRAAMVLSDLLKRADQRAGELAGAYDRARIAGLACERTYDGLSK